MTPTVLRLLADRSFESRKKGAYEVEQLCRRLREINGRDAIRKLVGTLAEDFAFAGQPNQRKGGLIGLASCAIGLGTLTVEHLGVIMPAVIRNFSDPEPRVRYYACESLFNVTKICRSAVLPFFPDIFASICKLVADVDNDVKSGAGLYDRLLKEVVLETSMEGESRGVSRGGVAGGGGGSSGGVFDVARFVVLLRGHMGVTNPYVRQLLVGWVGTLNSMPALDMLDFLDQLLEGLFDMLADGNREIRQQAYTALAEFLDDMRRVPYGEIARRVRFSPMVAILVQQTSRDRDKFNRLTAVEWLSAFVQLGQALLAPVLPHVVGAALHCLSDPEAEIVLDASRLSGDLSRLVRAILATGAPSSCGGTQLDTVATVAVVARECASGDKATRLAALRWLALLLGLCPDTVCAAMPATLPALIGNLSDASDLEVLKLNLEVLARLCAVDSSFLEGQMLPQLVALFGTDRGLLEARGSFIIRRLCLLLDAQLVYGALARILANERNREFSSLVVELLSLILLTAVETRDLREALRGCGGCCGEETTVGGMLPRAPTAMLAPVSGASDACTSSLGMAGEAAESAPPLEAASNTPADAGTWPVFCSLYHTWCVNPVATLALCLHAQCYELCARLVGIFSEVSITVGVLMQCDKLVQLLESPIYISVRMHLAQPDRPGHAALMRALYGLLMIMPQGTAYATLRDRLAAVAPLTYAAGGAMRSGVARQVSEDAKGGEGPRGRDAPDTDALFFRFRGVQQQYQAHLAAEVRCQSLLMGDGSGAGGARGLQPSPQ